MIIWENPTLPHAVWKTKQKVKASKWVSLDSVLCSLVYLESMKGCPDVIDNLFVFFWLINIWYLYWIATALSLNVFNGKQIWLIKPLPCLWTDQGQSPAGKMVYPGGPGTKITSVSTGNLCADVSNSWNIISGVLMLNVAAGQLTLWWREESWTGSLAPRRQVIFMKQ